MDRESIIRRTREALESVGPQFSFSIIEAGVREDDAWWYIPVIARTAAGKEAPYEPVVNVYANLEEKLQNDGLNILFIPSAA